MRPRVCLLCSALGCSGGIRWFVGGGVGPWVVWGYGMDGLGWVGWGRGGPGNCC